MIATKEKQISRVNICKNCEFVKYIIMQNLMVCSSCKCAIRAKVSLDNSKCPKEKW